MSSSARTPTSATDGGRWTGPAWWLLVAACAVAGAVATFFFSFFLLAWLMATADIATDPVGTVRDILRPGGIAAQIGVPSLACVAFLTGITAVLARAYRARRGLSGGHATRRILLILGTALVTVVGGAWLVLFVAFTKLDFASAAVSSGPWRGVILPLLVIAAIVIAVLRCWSLVLRGRSEADGR